MSSKRKYSSACSWVNVVKGLTSDAVPDGRNDENGGGQVTLVGECSVRIEASCSSGDDGVLRSQYGDGNGTQQIEMTDGAHPEEVIGAGGIGIFCLAEENDRGVRLTEKIGNSGHDGIRQNLNSNLEAGLPVDSFAMRISLSNTGNYRSGGMGNRIPSLVGQLSSNRVGRGLDDSANISEPHTERRKCCVPYRN